jgi:hypothetical protein
VNAALWVIQVLLAALFVFAGGMKLVMPLDQLAGPVALPGWFLRFIGVVELLGGLGLVLPAATGIFPWLTPLAAAGLVVVMIGAVGITLVAPSAAVLIPLVVGALCVVVAYQRSRTVALAPRRSIGH